MNKLEAYLKEVSDRAERRLYNTDDIPTLLKIIEKLREQRNGVLPKDHPTNAGMIDWMDKELAAIVAKHKEKK